MPMQFVFDLSLKNIQQEVDRFCQYFNCIEKIRIKADESDTIGQINQLISQNKCINHEAKPKVLKKYELSEEMYNGRNIWLIKPNDFNRGRGVRLFNTLEDLRRLLSEFTNGTCTDFFVNHACA